MRNTRSRLVMVGIVAGVAVLSVGATAYAAGRDSRPVTNVVAVASSSAPAPTVRATPSATPSTSPAPVAAAPAGSADAPDEVVVADVATNTDGIGGDGATGDDASDGAEGDGNIVEVRTPNPDAIPDTPAEYEHFYGLITQCMKEAGFDWHAVRHTVDGEFAGVDMTSAGDVEPGLQAGFTLALYGDTGGGDYYHWADAGCWGYAVHVTGNDGNN